MGDIYEQIDNLYAQINQAKDETAQVASHLNLKIKELQNICIRYAEEAYRFMGYLKDNTNISQKDLDTYKYVIDSCISSDSFKKELEHKYITKDIKEYYKAKVDKVYEGLEKSNDEFVERALRDCKYQEDDTDTLVIIEKKNNEKDELNKDLYYNVETKSFIDNTDEKNISKVFEEVFKEEK